MDEYSGKRGPDGLLVSRKGSSLVLRDTGNNKDKNGQFCNRIGCSGRLNPAKGSTQINFSGKPQSSRASIRPSSSGKEIVGSSSRTYSAISTRKPLPECRKKFSSRVEPDSSSESVGIQDDPDVPELEPSSRKLHKGNQSSASEAHTGEIPSSTQLRSSNLASSNMSHGDFHQRSILGHPHTLASSSSSLSLKNTVQGRRSNVGRNGLRNFRCNSVADVVVSSGSTSSSDSSLNKRKDPVKKRVCHAESSSSSARGKKMTNSLPEGRISTPTSGISISDSRRARTVPPIRDNPVSSVRTRRSVTGFNYNRPQGARNNLSLTEAHALVPQIPQHDMSIDLSSPTTSSHQFLMEPLGHPSFSRPGSSSASSRGIRPSSPTADISNMRSFLNRENFRRYNMDGVAEELLALEERMGNVSTAVKEDELSDCLKTSIYQLVSMERSSRNPGADMEDIKCSICQEEYGDGDELGRLRCEHEYHLNCIHQWLRLKNWCPVCKSAAVVPTQLASSPLSPPPSLL
ncbi:unnamed protein product [Linum tenue]|uniref:RING-type E3 ubiquitin transferase n=1 Tax=Linum tenue TaxID=586396 RepID=A0AAV0LXA8_9ROSI|nr:unnamed protein product [Linum tenue]